MLFEIKTEKWKTISTEYLEFTRLSKTYKGVDIFQEVNKTKDGYLRFANPKTEWVGKDIEKIELTYAYATQQIKLTPFPIANIDLMKEDIPKQSPASALNIARTERLPYGIANNYEDGTYISRSYYNLVGLLTKT